MGSIEDTNIPPGQLERAYQSERHRKLRLWISGTTALVFCVGVALLIPWAQRILREYQNQERIQLQLATHPVFRGLRTTDPTAYAAVQSKLSNEVRRGKSSAELDALLKRLSRNVTEHRLRRATPATVRHIAKLRVKILTELMIRSPMSCYDFVTTADVSGAEAAALADFVQEMGTVLSAPLAPKPLPLNLARAEKQAAIILNRLTYDELAALQYPDRGWTDRVVYCRAIIHIYQQALALPDPDCAQVLRYLELIPPDDRKAGT